MPVRSASIAVLNRTLFVVGPAVRSGKSGPHQILAVGFVLASMLFVVSSASAQTPPARPASAAKTGSVTTATKTSFSRPVWAQLTVQQQVALRPLAEVWDPLSEAQKRKWLEISKSYPSLAPEDQAKMHSRLVEWVAMSPQQRAAARLNFGKTQELASKLSADEKKAKWQSYQALSPEEKRRLAEKAPPRPTGAATALKPVAPQKLTAVSDATAPRENRAPTRTTPLQPELKP